MKISKGMKDFLKPFIFGLIFGAIGGLVLNLIYTPLDIEKHNGTSIFSLMFGLAIGVFMFLGLDVIFKNNTKNNELMALDAGVGISIALVAGLAVNNYSNLGCGLGLAIVSMSVYGFNKLTGRAETQK